MTISFIALKDSLNKAFRLIKPRRKDLDTFKANFQRLLSHIDEKETEENVKIHLLDFLKNTYYHPNHLIATKGRTDFVIHIGKDAQTPAGVLFEVKKPSNKAEMVTKTNLNTKAMHELILYFLRERLNNKNTSLTHLVITNIYEWFVFDAVLFEKVFTQNSQLQKSFKEWESGQKVSTNTTLFYNDIIKPFLLELDKEIGFAYFDIRDYIKYLKNDNEKDDNKLIPLFKFFTPTHLLKLPFVNDSNSLDKGFYSELLHIIGLEEIKDGGRKIIRRLPEGKRYAGSLIENTINILEVQDDLRKVPNRQAYGKSNDEQLFNLSLELSITWVNRILFLKLLEAQLIKYHNGDQQYRFLNIKTIRDYDELYKLFFQVLAKQTSERTALIRQKYDHIPYLNSSLFEISELEDQTLKINGLDDNLDISIYSNSVLKKGSNKTEPAMMNTLHYFFEFLDAYDFASVGKEEIQEENKTIINAAVLGLVFEKINGYKDGSIYTPGAVTMFLCRETIRKAVVKRFNDTYNWNCESITDIGNYIADKRNAKDILKFNELVESIRIADPAVGSGHFLVSSLNEIITIKAELGILADVNGSRLSGIEVSIANDELIITDRHTNNFFEYVVNKNSMGAVSVQPEVQRVQETLFNEKRKIIEGSLFGVDINPNSVKICRLRLWIELLKHAYYKIDQHNNVPELETLPNIDINIKHGNSLLSKYSLTEDLSDVFKKQKFGVKDYRLAVEAYKEAENKEAKSQLQNFIKTIKEQFHETVSRRDPRRKRLSELRGQLALAQNNFDLFGQKRSQEEMEVEIKKINIGIEKVEKEITEIENNAVYRNAFEWRFEFPEVLDERGDFEGFEVIIGNPPYIQLQKMGEDADVLQSCGYKTFTRTGDIYCLFYEQAISLLKSGYFFGYITSNKWMRANYGAATRRFFLEETNPQLLVDFGGYQVFESATVDTNLLISQKAGYSGTTETCLLDKSLGSLEKMSVFISQSVTTQSGFKPDGSWVILSSIEAAIKTKIEAMGKRLKDWDITIYRGVLTGYNEAFIIDQKTRAKLIEASSKNAEIIRPILRGRDILKYKADWQNLYLIATFPTQKIDIESYPAIKEHLLSFGIERLDQTGTNSWVNGKLITSRKKTGNKWFETQDQISYHEDFNKTKIIYPEITKFINFIYDKDGYLVNNKCFILTGRHIEYLTAFLNSSIFKFCFLNNFPELLGGTRELRKIFFELIPVKLITDEINEFFKEKVIQIQSLKQKGENTIEIEKEIDKVLFKLYELTEEEQNSIGFIQI
ncbi:MAG TPA: TaqI-like C-terminal specificity domain-containing protein [Sphingobacteriaceae bacterium]|nr:TaqI-like C-terminal specificity domain-containing protein [Sphingobacteriaceae bacterium]